MRNRSSFGVPFFLCVMLLVGASSSSAESFLYWANFGDNTIVRALPNGSNAAVLLSTASSSTGIAVDSSHVYWANSSGGTIGRANLNGSDVEQNFITGLSNVQDVTVNADYIYWSESGSIGRAKIDGSAKDSSFIPGTNPFGLALDSTHIYWADLGASSAIARANLDGSNPNTGFITGGSLNLPEAIAVNDDHIYWSNFLNNTISRAEIDGSNAIVLSSGPLLNNPWGIALSDSNLYWVNFSANTLVMSTLNGSAAVIIGSGANQPTDLTLTPPGEISVSPGAGSFGEANVGSASNKTFTVSDIGTGALGISSAALSGADSSQFSIVSNSCTGVSLVTYASCSISVAFNPSSTGTKTASLVVSHDGDGDGSVALSGNGTIAPAVPTSGTSSETVASTTSTTSTATPAAPLSLTVQPPGFRGDACIRRISGRKSFTVPYTLSAAANVEAVLYYRTRSRKLRHSCKKGTSSTESSDLKVARKWEFSSASGSNKLKVALKGLKVGRYTLDLVATDGSSQRSKLVGTKFFLVSLR